MANVVTFDPTNRLIIEINVGSPAVNELDSLEIYSEWKDWLLSDPSRLGWPQAFTPVGGDPRTLTESLGITRFLENGWRIRPAEYNHKLTVTGNIFAREPGESIFRATVGAFNVHTETVVSNVIDQVTIGGIDQATVQAAMTAQGYTTVRAPKIDNLDATISSRAEPGQGLTVGQASALTLLDVAISTRATPGQGLTNDQATMLANILLAADVPTSTVAAAVWARVVDGSVTAAESVRLMNAVLGGKVVGAGTGTEHFRNIGDTKDRVVATVDSLGNRLNVLRDLT